MSKQAKRAREGLIKGGDLATAGYTVAHTYGGRLDFVPTLDVYAAEAEKALAFVRRVGIEPMGQWVEAYRGLADALRGETSDPSGEAVPSTGTPTTQQCRSMDISAARSPPPSSTIRRA